MDRPAALRQALSAPVTDLLLAWGRGNESALDRLVPFVHAELHRLARRYMRGERAGHTLQTTVLVNEVYLRLVDPRKSQVVELRYFGGLTVEETAEALSVSAETVMRDWRLAKIWLLRELGGRG